MIPFENEETLGKDSYDHWQCYPRNVFDFKIAVNNLRGKKKKTKVLGFVVVYRNLKEH